MPKALSIPLSFVFILLVSCFWPVTVTAQNNTEPSNSTTPVVEVSGLDLCPLTGVEVVSLDDEQAIAIQGIVKQDVATSARNYREQKAIEELGLNETRKTESQRRLEKYNLYFMGPDGNVFYAPKLKDSLTNQNGWLIGTTIDGRVEYGGMMAEDLAMCPELPVNETADGICTKATGERTDDFQIKPGGYTTGFVNQSVETAGSAWVSMVNSLALHPEVEGAWGYVSLDPSRIKSDKWTTTLSVFPAGGATYVIPRTYMYFNARMKSLAIFDSATQGLFMAHALGTLVGPLTTRLFKGRTFMRTAARNDEWISQLGRTRADELRVARKELDDALAELNRIDPIKDPVRAERVCNKVKKNARIIKEQAETIGKSQASKKHFNFIKSSVIDDIDQAKFPSDAATRGSLRHQKLMEYGVQQDLMPKKLIGKEMNKFTHSDLDEYHKLLGNMGEEQIFNKVVGKKDVGALTDPSIFDFSVVQKKFPSDLVEGIDNVDLSRAMDMSDSADQLIKGADSYSLGAQTKNVEALKVGKDLIGKSESSLLLEHTDEFIETVRRTVPKKVGDAGYKTTTKGSTFKHLRRIVSGEWALGTQFAKSSTAGRYVARGVILAQKSAFSLIQSIYKVARPIALVAYGVHLGGLIFESRGFLEMSSPGLSMHWDPQETGPLMTPKSNIILLGVPKDLPAFYEAGRGGYFVGKDIAGFLTSMGVDPMISAKYSKLGQNLLFGGIMYEPPQGIISVEQEKARGFTKITEIESKYRLSLYNWENHDMVMVEDPASMELIQDNALSALGMRTTNIDLYKHSLGQMGQVQNVFPMSWTLTDKLSDWGFQSKMIGVGTVAFLLPSIPTLRYPLAPLLISVLSEGVFGAGQDLITSKVTSMKDLEKCYTNTTYEGSVIDCNDRPPCEEVEARCEGQIGLMSAYLGISGTIQMITERSAVATPINLGLGIADYIVISGPGEMEGKIEITERCMQELLTCNERSFLVVGGSQYSDPSVIKAEEEQAQSLKSMPLLDQLPIEDFLEGFEQGKNDSLIKPAQLQLNVHSEMDHATGRVDFKEINYVHLKDARVDWLTDELSLHLCPEYGGDVQDELCVTIEGNTLYVGDKAIVTDELVPFKWLDLNLPALVIPNTAVAINMNETNDCAIFTADKTGKNIHFNPTIKAEFTKEHFDELERLMGPLRDIETDEGAVYPNMDYNGDYRWEHDSPDGSFVYTEKDVSVTGKGQVHFGNQTLTFRSAVFEGGVVTKKGDKIYIVPKYFKTPMKGEDWYQATKGHPFVSDTGQALEVFDEDGNLMGINGSLTRIPGGDKLGTITKVIGEDENGDEVSFAFTEDENGTKVLQLTYGNQTETYGLDQVEVDEASGCIFIYEKGKPHIEANMIRKICMETKPTGETVINISNPQTGETLAEGIVEYILGTGGAIRYDKDNNNYVFVNGQPIRMNNEFKTNGFNPITGRPEAPLLQPTAVDGERTGGPGTNGENGGYSVPIRPEGMYQLLYLLVLAAGLFAANYLIKKKTRKTP